MQSKAKQNKTKPNKFIFTSCYLDIRYTSKRCQHLETNNRQQIYSDSTCCQFLSCIDYTLCYAQVPHCDKNPWGQDLIFAL